MRYKTTAAYVGGAICGHTWMPDAMAGKPHRFGVRDAIDRFSDPRRTTFRQALLSELNREGGDFQNPRFSYDTVLRVERGAVESPGRYRVHVLERPIRDLPGCADLVNEDYFTSDAFGDED